MPFENEIWHARLAQMLTHRNAGLAATNDEGVYSFNRHLTSFPGLAKNLGIRHGPAH
jgi:hypothetical protein